jgi:ATP-dependent Clp protease ATP-binding subunit ClpA
MPVQRKHQYTTLEHLLLALIDDVDASLVMKACKVDLGALKEKLTNYIDSDLKTLVIDDGREPTHTAGFQRVLQRAGHYAKGRGRPNRTGAELLVAIFAETESPAARLLGEQDMTQAVKTQSTSSSRVSQRVVETPQLSRCRKLSCLLLAISYLRYCGLTGQTAAMAVFAE